MTKTVIALLSAAFLVVPTILGQSTPLPDPNKFLDAAVDSKGTVYELRQRHLRTYTASGEQTEIALNLSQTVPDPGFSRLISQALAITDKNEAAVLWSGSRPGGVVETYVYFVRSGRSVRLGRPLGSAIGLSISPTGDIYAFGVPKNQVPSMLIHQFDSRGEYVRSFHPHTTNDSADHDARKSVSQSRMVCAGESLYVLSPFLSNLIFEYRGGNLTRTHDLAAAAPAGTSRSVISIFRAGNSVLAHTFVRKTSGGGSRSEILRVTDGLLYRSVASYEIAGPVLGITPDGRLVDRNASLGPSRNTISFR
jgi:hypothetical protein